jgi:ABC-type branched-subunit amino acid transport system ATPase component
MTIRTLSVENLGCVRKVEVALTPLHAFIGPNDSGKSTLLRAVRAALQFSSGTLRYDEAQQLWPFDPGFEDATNVRITSSTGASYGVSRFERVSGHFHETILSGTTPFESRSHWQEPTLSARVLKESPLRARMPITHSNIHRARGEVFFAPAEAVNALVANNQAERAIIPRLEETLRPFCALLVSAPRMFRLEPDSLRKPSRIIESGAPIDFSDEKGTGLAAVIDAIRDLGDGSFEAIRDDVVRLFRGVQFLRLTRGKDVKRVAIALKDGREVDAPFMSEGLLYYLAYAAARRLAPTSVLLVEEPENGLHPARIAEVMKVLREISKTTQVLLATHSPFVINELTGDEVSVVTRTEAGTQVRRLSDTPNFAERSKVYSLGELWVSYANGEDEAPLFKEPIEPDAEGEPGEWSEDSPSETK